MMDFDALDEREHQALASQLQDSCTSPAGQGAGAAQATADAEADRHLPHEPAVESPVAAVTQAHAFVEEPSSPVKPQKGNDSEEPAPVAAAAGGEPPAGTGAKQGPEAGVKESAADVKQQEAAEDSKGAASLATDLFNPDMMEKLDKRCGGIPAVRAAADALGLSPLVVAVAGTCCAVAFLLHGFGGKLLCTLLGFLYPAFESFKAAEHCQPSIMQFWLMYWVVWALFITAEHLCYYIVIWIPFYYPIKLAALVWLFHPATKGARFVYRWFLLPVLLRNREKIDAALEASGQQIKRGVSGALSSAVGAGFDTAKAAGAGALPTVRKLSGLAMEVVWARRLMMATTVEGSD
mmetsp:Transcript_11376/g.34288  ORF Transcript_11376/g.34288 Transcript_11376/m.34288 type:complete len:350 (-) Transcript_11376:113-1162(-)